MHQGKLDSNTHTHFRRCVSGATVEAAGFSPRKRLAKKTAFRPGPTTLESSR